MKVALTGGLGFIGSDMVRYLVSETGHQVLNIDSKTYAATEGSVSQVRWSPRYSEANVDICDAETVSRVLSEFGPDIIIHMAAESHVDRSIDAPRGRVRGAAPARVITVNTAVTRRRDSGRMPQLLLLIIPLISRAY